MKRITTIIAAALAASVCIGSRPALAAVCGDANGNGTVTVTDGVQMLRSAVGLSGCELKICDLTLDGRMTVTDGVLALRKAANLPADASCIEEQIDQQVARVDAFLDIGLGALPAVTGRARAAQTIPCADGGVEIVTETAIQDIDCRNGTFVSNGTIFFEPFGEDTVVASTNGFRLVNLANGAELVSTGSLDIVFDGSSVTFNGAIDRVSNVVGSFTDVFTDVVTDENGVAYLGEVITNVTNGVGLFRNLRALRTNYLGGTALLVGVEFTNGVFEGVIRDGDVIGLCNQCTTSDDCDAILGCFPCQSDCTGAPFRCSVRLDLTADCGDGQF